MSMSDFEDLLNAIDAACIQAAWFLSPGSDTTDVWMHLSEARTTLIRQIEGAGYKVAKSNTDKGRLIVYEPAF